MEASESEASSLAPVEAPESEASALAPAALQQRFVPSALQQRLLVATLPSTAPEQIQRRGILILNLKTNRRNPGQAGHLNRWIC